DGPGWPQYGSPAPQGGPATDAGYRGRYQHRAGPGDRSRCGHAADQPSEREIAMPLQSGSSDAAVSNNIKRQMDAGKPQDQAIAIAMKKAGRSNQEAMKEGFRKMREAHKRKTQ